jgi:hypothetical protein
MTAVNHGARMPTDGKYLYGFIHTDQRQSFGPIGIEGVHVSAVPYRDIAAVISNLPHMEFDALPKETLLRYLTVYQSVLETALKVQQIIPVKFGTVLEGDASLQVALEQGHNRVLAGLREMEHKIELDIAALWPVLDPVLAEIGEVEEIKALKKNASGMSEDDRFDLRVKVGKRIKTLLDQRREQLKDEIMHAILPYAEAHRVHGLMDDSMLLNVAILIQREQASSLEADIARLDRCYDNRINFRIIGPLPPYSFQTLEIREMDYALLNAARKILGLEEETTLREIREAYWKLTKKFHPDRFPGDSKSQKRFEKINEAYRRVSEYCKDGACSFRKEEVRKWIRVQPVEDRSPMSEVQSHLELTIDY